MPLIHGVLLTGFNPRACGRRDNWAVKTVIDLPVSIHAPVGGATMGLDTRSTLFCVSIHAPVGGAT